MIVDDKDEVIDSLRKRYVRIPHIIFHRSVERADNFGHLFDILESCPDKYPILWDDKEKVWKITDDLLQKNTLEEEI